MIRGKTMSCPAITIEGIRPDIYSTLISQAASQGLDINGPSGNTSFQGMDFRWEYNEEAQTLTIECTAKPFFVPCSMIESRIRSLIA